MTIVALSPITGDTPGQRAADALAHLLRVAYIPRAYSWEIRTEQENLSGVYGLLSVRLDFDGLRASFARLAQVLADPVMDVHRYEAERYGYAATWEIRGFYDGVPFTISRAITRDQIPAAIAFSEAQR